MVADQQDALAAQAEFLSFVGRDDSIVALVDFSDSIVEIIPPCRALLYHYKAVALMRQGHVNEAQAAWKRCLKLDPNCPPAKMNLDELKAATDCHAPWAEVLHKWIPYHAMNEIVATLTSGEHETGSRMPEVLRKWPHLIKLAPAMLDRGDRGAREFALLLAKADSSPEMLNALKDFATGQRGPDSMRVSTILFLRTQNFLGDEPVSIWKKGAWTDIVPYSAEISYEQVPHPNSRVNDLVNVGVDAMHEKDLDAAEAAFRQCIKIDPDFPSALYNLSGALLMKNDEAAGEEAEQILQDLFARFPDYPSARITLAQLAIHAGRIDEAQELIAPLASRSRWHVSEAMAHGTVILELALARKDFPAAEASLRMMRQLDADDPRVEQLHRRIQIQKNPLALLGGAFQQVIGRLRIPRM
ncbi:MAG: tetratricopeptide repeat protein [Planctomycetaceae bacterium]